MEKIAIISYPITSSFVTPLSNLIDIVNQIPGKKVAVYIAVNDKEKLVFNSDTPIFSIPYSNKEGILGRIINYTRIEFLITHHIIKMRRNINKIIIFMEGDALLPSIVAKLLGIPTVKLLPSGIIAYDLGHNRHLSLNYIILLLQIIGNLCVDIIGIYGTRILNEWSLQYLNKKKIRIISEHFVDIDVFNITTPYSERDDVIAFIGRLSSEKGIIPFIESIPRILNENPSIKIIIIGSGTLQNELEEDIKKINVVSRIILLPWVNHNDLPIILNQIKLLVVPSFTEGIPNILLEAMACGTPVLSNSVGAIPDIISNGVNGFLLKNNNPDEISQAVLQCFKKEDLVQISLKALITVKSNYQRKFAIIKWEKLLDSI